MNSAESAILALVSEIGERSEGTTYNKIPIAWVMQRVDVDRLIARWNAVGTGRLTS